VVAFASKALAASKLFLAAAAARVWGAKFRRRWQELLAVERQWQCGFEGEAVAKCGWVT
jgi:hypothetical protein